MASDDQRLTDPRDEARTQLQAAERHLRNAMRELESGSTDAHLTRAALANVEHVGDRLREQVIAEDADEEPTLVTDGGPDRSTDQKTIDRVMVDIETLGLEPGTAIISIGAVRFGPGLLGATFDRSVSIESCQDAGLTIDAETLAWWLQQDEAAQQQLSGGDSLSAVLFAFSNWYGDADEIWANSPSFDCEILEAAYDAIGESAPWSLQDERDYRTLRSLPCATDVDQDGLEHDALADAKHQAYVAAATLRRLADRSWHEEVLAPAGESP